jgi:tetratricopeptide (TPR) repeat protein
LIWSVAVSPDGARIVTGSGDNTARVWDAKTFAALSVLKGHTDSVWSVAVSPDGTRIVTGSRDNTARVWDAKTFAELAILKGHTDWVRTVAVSPDGTRIFTGSENNTARVWDLLPFGQTLANQAKAVAPRCLTPAERQRHFLAPTPPDWCSSLSKWPYDAVSGLIEGVRLLNAGGFEDAEIIFAALLRHDPTASKRIDEAWVDSYLSRGTKLLDAGKDEEAKAQFALALQRDPGAALLHLLTSEVGTGQKPSATQQLGPVSGG